MQVGRVDPVRLGERADGLRGERRQLHPLDAGGGGQVAQHDADGRRLVVAERDDRERGDAGDAATEQAQDVERALVGPVDVLQHEDRAGRGAQPVEQRGRERGRRGLVEPDVEQRAERPRRVQRVARAPQDATTVGEGADERGLADAGLAADQDQPAGRAVEDVEEGLALE